MAQFQSRLSHSDLEQLQSAYKFVKNQNDLYQPEFATSILQQGMDMATALNELNCDANTLTAAIAYPAFFYGKINESSLKTNLGPVVTQLLLNIQKMESIQSSLKNLSKNKLDKLRKMILAIVDDIRIVLIKLSECLVILKYLRSHENKEKKAIAEKTMSLYAPLANRLGIGQFKWQLEDLAFRYLHTKEYMEIKRALNMRREEREKYIATMIKKLTQLFTQIGIKNVKITGRAKHIYSIYRKMQKKQISFEQLYDTFAFRFLVPSIEDCYRVLSIIHEKWTPIQKEFDDYIANPKANGYQSIHTAITGPQQMNIEIQIRTYKMHTDAELGIAAHWKYKEKKQPGRYEEKINRLRKIIDWNKSEVAQEEENLYAKIFADQIYVFTPQGDIFDLTTGSTPIDFAYHVHTEVGHACRGAKVNGQLVPLTHKLKTGDQIEILTAKESKPSRDWLNPSLGYIATSNARTKIRHWFQRHSYREHLETGESLWEKLCRREGIKKLEISKVSQHFGFKNTNDLLAAIGNNEISLHTVMNYLKTEILNPKEETQTPFVEIKKEKMNLIKSGFVIEGIDNLLAHIAKCCQPLPGDAIIAYVTKDRGASIHHQNCPNIKQAIRYRPNRVMKVQWGSQEKQRYPINLTIEADNRAGLMRDLTALIAHERISILGVQSHVDVIKDQAYINLTVEVANLTAFDKLQTKLRQISGVIAVRRI